MLKYIFGGIGLTSIGIGFQPYIEAVQPYSLYFIFGGIFLFTFPLWSKLFNWLFKDKKESIVNLPVENRTSKPFSTCDLNAWLADKPHKCSYCGYSFSTMPELEEGKNYFAKTAKCPKCGNVDETLKFYQS